MKNIITISAPSGSGKTTLCKALRKVRKDIGWSISYTTRQKRKNEQNGVDYHFISTKEFEDRILKDEFAEWENVHGNYYGTSKFILKKAINNNEMLLFELDVKGAMSIKANNPDNTYSIFILPPSIEALRERLINRETDTMKRIEIRLKRFEEELGYKDRFDFVIINNNLELAIKELINVVNQLKEGVLYGN
tara:strand:+ start:56 stop:631 length:576 start_codon:yes stop_codon:yes gene_type:complete